MWKVRVFCFFICTACLLDINCANIGYEGKHVTFHISYPEGYETNTKYFGKKDGFFFEKLVQTSHPYRWAKQGRFALFDNTSARILTATILQLVVDDSGLYSFGVDVKLSPDLSGDIQLTVRRGEAQRPTISLPRVIVSSTNSPANITAQNWTKTRNQESSLKFVSVLSLVCVCTLLVVCPFAVFKVLKWAATCKLSVSVSYHTRKTSTQVVDEYVNMSRTVLPNPPTAQNDEGSLVDDFHRPTNTEQTHNKDANYIDFALADSPDQIYTEMNPGFVQESVYQSIDLTIN
ncbi:uncharacterized protein LOC127500027 isoform X2 [Ctenopharyngodon idella]|uniref:uncharacterized protein LOC127500027 isoform X2 n=1 Tax=Ctenopharyngodon idella TaxID=7959 RepID=UPI00222E272F|nr:uncharacterized protein LOC127500027 isoform X2 [Ctenopharyngodon idella]